MLYKRTLFNTKLFKWNVENIKHFYLIIHLDNVPPYLPTISINATYDILGPNYSACSLVVISYMPLVLVVGALLTSWTRKMLGSGCIGPCKYCVRHSL